MLSFIQRKTNIDQGWCDICCQSRKSRQTMDHGRASSVFKGRYGSARGEVPIHVYVVELEKYRPSQAAIQNH